MSTQCARCKTTDMQGETASYIRQVNRFQIIRSEIKGIRLFGSAIYLNHDKGGQRAFRHDETLDLCPECSDLLIGHFLQGRSVKGKP